MLELRFDNRYVRELPGDASDDPHPRPVHGACWSSVMPTPVTAPRLLAHAPEVAGLLGIDPASIDTVRFAEVFGGNALLPGMAPYAACYGGHQFGHWAGQLGDGRAITLGESVNAAGERWELQLKGAGPTPYSRRADGRAVLRSSIREFLCSEAMHHLGVPTTRALSLVATGEQVMRDMFYDGHPALEPGAVVCRVAPSFIRFGHFEIHAERNHHALLERLVDFTIARDFPEIEGTPDEKRARWFADVCERTAHMVAHWMRVGFVHGVMNTDNMSILGLTIDYGPYGWIDNYDPDWTPNTTDAEGRRYRFGQQPQIAHWNLACLAEAVAPLFADPNALHDGLERYQQRFLADHGQMLQNKFGFSTFEEADAEIAEHAFERMRDAEIDMTVFFRRLAEIDLVAPQLSSLTTAFYATELPQRQAEALQAWLVAYTARLRQSGEPNEARRNRMNLANPIYVLRNYLAQEAIDLATQGDTRRIQELLEVLRRPYTEQPGRAHFAALRPDWARSRPGCSMLSCSS